MEAETRDGPKRSGLGLDKQRWWEEGQERPGGMGVSEWPAPAGGGEGHVGEGGEPTWLRIVTVVKSSLIFPECYCQPGAALSSCQGLTHRSILSRRWAGRVWRVRTPRLAPVVGLLSHCCLIGTPRASREQFWVPPSTKISWRETYLHSWQATLRMALTFFFF